MEDVLSNVDAKYMGRFWNVVFLHFESPLKLLRHFGPRRQGGSSH